jgi:preprotein translocase subunit SecB
MAITAKTASNISITVFYVEWKYTYIFGISNCNQQYLGQLKLPMQATY